MIGVSVCWGLFFYIGPKKKAIYIWPNYVMHSFAKFALSQPRCLFCNSANLPPSIREAWLRDSVALPS